MVKRNNNALVDDTYETVWSLIRKRLPWLLLGVIGGMLSSWYISRYEEILLQNIHLAFFLPVIVYMSDAVGTQTEAVYIRNAAHARNHFFNYLVKEIATGLFLGVIFGFVTALLAFLWLRSFDTAMVVGAAMAVNITVAPVIALVVAHLLYVEHTDAAMGAGPFTTIIQDTISLLVYFFIAAAMLHLV